MTEHTHRTNLAAATQRALNRTADTASDTVDTATDKAYSTVNTVADKAQQVANKAQDLGAQAVDRADDASTTVGGKMTDVAQTIRDNAPAGGPLANAAETAADTLEKAGTYLKEQDLSDMRVDVEGIIRRYPVQSLLVGLGVGYLLARSMRK